MMGRVLSAELLKIRKKGLWLLAFCGPVGLVALQALNFGIRYDYLTKEYAADLWGGLVGNIVPFIPVTVLAGITLICSLLANVEHQTGAWKQLLALPVPRRTVFAAKFAVSSLLLGFSCGVLALSTVALGVALRFGWDFPAADILRFSFLPFLASLPFLALLLWLSIVLRNQTLPVTLGMVSGVCSLFTGNLSEFAPINWPMFAAGPAPVMRIAVGGGLLLGTVVYLIGSAHFNRKDVS
ncbi:MULTISPECIES: ABC transporter permease [Cohnella]|uniref:ABC transporter permease n=1 Tax=Cohnella TaxID=329857 RepID=UPI0009BA7DEF|nr:MULTISPECIES: ABC transporter permease [Cohnella]MBN2983226.1 ABC transporter permease [Cohnella algarum]